MRTFYDWIISEINEWGYTAEDIVLVTGDGYGAEENQVISPEDFKRATSVATRVFEKYPQESEGYITIFENFRIHFKDGSIALYKNHTRCYDYDVHENEMELIKSIAAIKEQKPFELVAGYTKENSHVDNIESLDQILSRKGYKVVEVNIQQGIELDDYYVIQATGLYSPGIILSTKTRQLGFNFGNLRLNEIEDYILFLSQFPIVSDELFEQNVTTMMNEMYTEIVPDDNRQRIPSFKGMVDFFMAAHKVEQQDTGDNNDQGNT